MLVKEIRKILDQIRKSKGTIFSVGFTKKDGTYRTMVARLGVAKGVTGEGLKFKTANDIGKRNKEDTRNKYYNLLPVYDMHKNAYRMINIDTINFLQIKGQEVLV